MKQGIGIFLLALLVFFPAVATWSCATGRMGSDKELIIYSTCWLAGGCMVIFYGVDFFYGLLKGLKSKTAWSLFLCLGFVCGLFAIFQTSLHSSRMFLRWKVKAVPGIAWPALVSDLERIREQKILAQNTILAPQELPETVWVLGMTRECLGGKFEDDGNPKPGISLIYGSSMRRWGLWLGSGEFFQKRWPKATFTQVATNALFFVTTSK